MPNAENDRGRVLRHKPEFTTDPADTYDVPPPPPLPTIEEDAGPECDTCGKATCPDAALPEFSEPRECVYGPIYHALKDSKDCDYGCARDYTNQAVRLWVVEAVERIVAERLVEAAPLIRRAILDPGAFVKRGPDYDGNAYGERLDQWQDRAIAAALTSVLPPGSSDA